MTGFTVTPKCILKQTVRTQMKCLRSGSALFASKDRNDPQGHLTLEILNCDPLQCAMDYTRLNVLYSLLYKRLSTFSLVTTLFN